MQEFAEELRALSPLPWGDAADSGRDGPDAHVSMQGGQLVVHYDRRGLLLRIDDLKARTTSKDPDEEVASWLPRAQWIIRSLEKRRLLLTRLLKWLVVEEREAFEKGTSFVMGADWRVAAEKLGVNLEAVFLLVGNKRVRTPRGTVLVSSFFDA
jgi:DNA-directed RNA polymerase specialized sigma54-like protein